MRFGWRKVVATMAVAAGIGAMSTAAANAANFTTDCTSNLLCVYNQAGFQDNLTRKASGFSHQNLASSQYGKMSSWENHSSKTGAWYDAAVGTFGADCFVMDSQTVNSNVGIVYNDSMVSWQGNGGC